MPITPDDVSASLVQLLSADERSTDGAVVFLNGPWGSGKTYFWKTQLQPALSAQTPLYVSLFGIRDVSELKGKLVSAILAGEEKGGKLAKARKVAVQLNPISTIGKFFRVEFKVDFLELVPGRFVVCFDDLERVPKGASLEEILGFINYLSEHKGYRCLVILNQGELKDGHKEEFERLREKLSLRTFQLPVDLPARVKAFVEDKGRAAKIQPPADEATRLEEAILGVETDNLRSMRFIVDCYFALRKALGKELPVEATKFLVAMVHSESKGKANDWDFYTFNPMEVYFRRREQKKGSATPDPQADFYLKYFGENSGYRPYRCVFDIVKLGYVDPAKASREVFPQNDHLSEVEKLTEEIKNAHFFFWNDDELIELKKKIETALASNNLLSISHLYSMAKGLAATIRLLEQAEPSAASADFVRHVKDAIKQVEDLPKFERGLDVRGDSLLKVHSDVFTVECETEEARRSLTTLDDAISSGTASGLKDRLIQSPQVLRVIWTGGYFDRIWKSSTLGEQEIYRLVDVLIKALAQKAGSDSKIKDELSEVHAYLTDRFIQATEKMMRLRIYRLLEETKLPLPKDAPALSETRW